MFLTLGAAVHRHRRAVLLAWAIVGGLGVLLAGPAVDRLRAAPTVEPGTEAADALAAQQAIGVGANAVTAVVPGAPAEAAVATALEELRQDLDQLEGVTYVATAGIGGAALTAPDGRSSAVVTLVDSDLEPDAAHEAARAVAERVRELPGARVGGDLLAYDEVQRVAERDAVVAEVVSTPVTAVAMAVIFAGVVAALIPFSVAGASILCALMGLLLVAQFTNVSSFAQNIVTLLGLGLGIDYGLLAVHRFREHRRNGLEVGDAVAATVATAGRTITFSALIVIISMSGMLLITTSDLRSLAIGGISVTVAAAVAAVTLLPALLSVTSSRIRIPRRGADSAHGAYARLAAVVQAHPVALGGAAVGVLLLMSFPLLHLNPRIADERFLPDGNEVRAVQEIVDADFPALAASPIVVVADVDAADPAFTDYRRQVLAMPGVSTAEMQPNPFGHSRPVVLLVEPEGDDQGATAQGVVRALRSGPTDVEVLVGGPAAQLVDSTASLRAALPFALGFVLVATGVLLWLFTGSVVLPVKAVVMNLLSVTAAFGVLVWAFQDGHLGGLLHFTPVGALELASPVMIFLFAFGLSMDYEVFLLGRIKEEYDRTGDNDAAVRVGLQRVGRLISSAAFLIVTVLGVAAATGSMLANQTFAFGLAAAVLIDATIVRSVLVPAAMTLMGGANWWSPAALRRAHAHVGISEGATDLPAPEPAAGS